MKIYTKEITDCGECPNCELRYTTSEDWCRKGKRYIKENIHIPSWCPLPDSEETFTEVPRSERTM
jgi:hypothetical protein